MLRLFDPDRSLRNDRPRLVYLAPVDWHTIWQRPQQLASRLSRHFELYYCDPVGLRSARPGDLYRIVQRVAPRTAVPARQQTFRPKYFPLVGVPGVDYLNKRWLRRQARELVDVGGQPWILWVGSPSLLAESLIESTWPDLIVYDCMDNYAAFHRAAARPHICRTERSVAERADVVFTTSMTLQKRLSDWSDQVVLVPNGADVSSFDVEPKSPPEWLAKLNGPLIGFHGTLGDWLDYDLLMQLADRRPEWSFVFIGPLASQRTEALLARPNVHWHDTVPHDELPRHSTFFDAAMIPFVINELTLSVHPIKVLEYLALGLPVVTSPLPDLQPLKSVLRMARDANDWEAHLAAAIHTDEHTPLARERRRVAVREQSWEHRTRRILAELDAALKRRAQRMTTPRPRVFSPDAPSKKRAA
jgi:glycosyltransferase involved in cell wall biosynthesis